ncbi:helix-turn-helix domain-containing protein [Virgibacillus salexigens]|uniref:Transcriptional regulator n=1 Tax=Virgibacillus kapii TaxID=1638645 RepID=A0ABQ2D8M1_9BACI|nr:helix-turn-helix transcriptional regulator [Virgibacillus kapii]GGJ49689.1 transcriptional regulator [Virgibacillus kapii]
MKAKVKIMLDETINKTEGLTRNKIAVEGKIRPATISELCNGKSKSISFETLTKIIDAMNELTEKRYVLEDIIKVEYENN